MFFRTSPVWSAREEEIKSNKAYFGMISSTGLVLQEKKKKKNTIHTKLSTPLWSFQISRSCPFSFCYPTCVFLDTFSTISFISPLCYIWLLHRDEPAQLLNKSLLNKAGWKLGKRLFNDCLAIKWLDGAIGKKKRKGGGGKRSPKEGMPPKIHLLNKRVLSSATYNRGLHISLPSDRKMGFGMGRSWGQRSWVEQNAGPSSSKGPFVWN